MSGSWPNAGHYTCVTGSHNVSLTDAVYAIRCQTVWLALRIHDDNKLSKVKYTMFILGSSYVYPNNIESVMIIYIDMV